MAGPTSHLPQRTWLWPAVTALALAGCTGLKPLPQAHLPACSPAATPAALWSCLDGTDRETHAGIGEALPRETAYQSTSRVTNGDLRRKLADQHLSKACLSAPPPGFEAWSAEPIEEDRAPLRAYLHRPQPGRATVIVVHGLYDSKNSGYVRQAAGLLAGAGFGVLVPDMRFHGCLLRGFLPTLGREEARDLVSWAAQLRARSPDSPVGLLGFSLGSLDVIRALAVDQDGSAFPAGGIAVSPPASLPLSLARLDDPPTFSDHGLQLLFRKFFQDALRTRMGELGILPPRGAERQRPFARFLAWLAKSYAFPRESTPETIVAAADPVPRLADIHRPLLLIASRRDPIFAESALLELRRGVEGRPLLHLVETTDGGHIGQTGRYPNWSAELFVRFFAASAGVGSSP